MISTCAIRTHDEPASRSKLRMLRHRPRRPAFTSASAGAPNSRSSGRAEIKSKRNQPRAYLRATRHLSKTG